MTSKRYFEFVEGSSSKFWEVWIDGNKVYTRYGKIGSNGQTTIKDEGSPAGAERLLGVLLRQKVGKGYVEGGAAAPVAAEAPAAPAPRVSKPAPAPAPVAVAPKPAAGGARRFEFVDGSSNKFWEVRVEGASQTVRYGRIGTDGQSKTKQFADAATALADAEALIEEKLEKGYTEVTAGAAAPAVAREEQDDDAEEAADVAESEPEVSSEPGRRRFEFRDENGGKFWEIVVGASAHTVRYGALGAPGNSKVTAFANDDAAEASAEALIAEKTRKGFTEV